MVNTKRIYLKKYLSILIAVITLVSSFSFGKIDAQAAQWKTGYFVQGGYTAGTTVYLTNKKKAASINFYTYKKESKGCRKNCQSKIDITMKDKYGRTIWQGTKSVGTNGISLKLGKDHSVYVIYFKNHTTLQSPDDCNPKYKTPDYWGIKYTSNCEP